MGRPIKNKGEIVQNDYHHPYEKRNRVYVEPIVLVNQEVNGTPTVLHTVTSGTTFFLTDIIITYNANSAFVQGSLVITDNGTVRIPFTTKASGEDSQGIPHTFNMDMPFTTNIEIEALENTFDVSLVLHGYEEPNE